jgi:hypothetical protein
VVYLELISTNKVYRCLFKLKNIAMSSQEIIKIEDDFTLIRFQNDAII